MPAILRRRQPADPAVDQDFLRAAADFGDKRVNDYRIYGNTYDGESYLALTRRQKTYLEACGIKWRENFTETIINIVKERMNLVGFQVDGNEEASDFLTRRLWQGNRMDGMQGTVHVQSMVKGDEFVLTTVGDDGMPRFHRNRAELHKPVYDDDGQLLYDVKKWSTSMVTGQNPSGALIWRLNLYYPDRVEKYFSESSDAKIWERWQDDGDTAWPVPWKASDDSPLGVCATHFRNQALGRNMGRSDVRGLIPFAHELDKQLLDLFAVMDTQGWPQRWATGVENAGALKSNPGEVWTGPEKAQFGQFDPANPEGPLAAVAATLHRMAAYARIPIHILLMEGQIPSGESLKTANSPLVKKADDRKVDAGNSWEDVIRLGWRVADTFAPDSRQVPRYDPDARITALWDSSEDRNEVNEVAVALQKLDLGVSQTTLLRELDYDPDDEAEKRAEEAAAAGPTAPDQPPTPVAE